MLKSNAVAMMITTNKYLKGSDVMNCYTDENGYYHFEVSKNFKPCPACGSSDLEHVVLGTGFCEHYIRCTNCNYESSHRWSPIPCKTPSDMKEILYMAAETWNNPEDWKFLSQKATVLNKIVYGDVKE